MPLGNRDQVLWLLICSSNFNACCDSHTMMTVFSLVFRYSFSFDIFSNFSIFFMTLSERRTARVQRSQSQNVSIDHSTVSVAAASEDEGNQVAIPKNIDRNVYFSNTDYRNLCQLCGATRCHMVQHYVNYHPESEVLISRVSPTIAHSIRNQPRLLSIASRCAITGTCCFCGITQQNSVSHWKGHLLRHTGEKMYHCNGCNTDLERSNQHRCSSMDVRCIFGLSLNDESAMVGYMCNICHYIQVSRCRLIDHLVNEHGYQQQALAQHITFVGLLLNPRINSNI